MGGALYFRKCAANNSVCPFGVGRLKLNQVQDRSDCLIKPGNPVAFFYDMTTFYYQMNPKRFTRAPFFVAIMIHALDNCAKVSRVQ